MHSYRNMPKDARMRQAGRASGRLMIGLAIAAFYLLQYFFSSDYNEVTGETQRIAMDQGEEIALGVQAAPEVAAQHGGLHHDRRAAQHVRMITQRLLQVDYVRDSGYQFNIHLLADDQTINAFALPGGQLFLTYGLYSQLRKDDEIAGVIGHEIGHVLARHGAQQLAKQQLTQGLTMATVAGTGDASTARMAQMIGGVVNMKYGRDDELESDLLGVRIMDDAGYDPYALIAVMEVLKRAGGGGGTPEFFSTHPNPDNRVEHIRDAIAMLE